MITLRRTAFLAWFLVSAAIAAYCYYLFFVSEDKTAILPGWTTDAHHQIEMQCAACHTDEPKENVFTSAGVTNRSCIGCHGEALNKFSDSHPVRKFKNPENAIFTEEIDALNCITCHGEHNQKVTGEMAVTVPPDYCAHCHEVTLENLDSHKDLDYKTCHTAGCHNYHDNTALEPSYLLKHYGEPKVLADPQLPALTKTGPCPDQWQAGSTIESCAKCHSDHHETFTQGKHGMRSAFPELSPMTPALARVPMKESAAHLQMDCVACHQADKPKAFAAHDACMQCHDDDHSKNYQKSTHFALFQAAPTGPTAVSCATCHLPRVENASGEIVASHDNTANLRPNEKMIRSVCASCHGLQFSLNALTDPDQIHHNFSHPPALSHPGLAWTADAAIARGDEKVEAIRQYLNNASREGEDNTNEQ